MMPLSTDTARTTLVIGGARSGKSRYAEELLAAHGGTRIYIATAEVGDAEMAARIAEHQARRGAAWQTIEQPLDLVAALELHCRPAGAVLVDCLTLWLSNLMAASRDIAAETSRLVRALPRLEGRAVLVSNEVGLGIVPEYPLGREFRDHAGRLNQAVAAAVDEAVFIAAGLPLRLKP
ncbi:MAG: bifunctional adenosylcobinamide kinase/adenosylcobinamide-phosphate guanylyltransferase [Proteobacteria bacterium]|nr:bifunctional adenosylcobinamide kinase/adenosylcobinamide-phosphate guanylyltransferase [Pseudomonadota bacterium]MDA1355624.1 bifunctional adenosylcobinamide kinase/adenosylcobinamide-phosphate guanylyltransferase [Pseudomonadota bacterium]